mmetsp:Transcript_8956/g.14366  ORF Transcript_8956/g.14366 Transcript_8956/m.14366 type:complete len:298 (-) Transcript_8956:131-1024(-)
MRTPKTHGDTKTLSRTDRNIRTPRRRRSNFGQCQEICGSHHHCTSGVSTTGEGLVAFSRRLQCPICVRVLDKGSTVTTSREINLGMIPQDNLDTKGFGSSLNQTNCLRVDILRHEKLVILSLFSLERKAHLHGFSGGTRFIQKRGNGHGEPCQVDNQCLKIQQHFQTSLGNFCLIGCVSSIPAGILQHVTQNDARNLRVVVPLPDIRFHDLVLFCKLSNLCEGLGLRHGIFQFQWFVCHDIFGNCRFDKFLKAIKAEGLQHGNGFLRSRTHVTTSKSIRHVQGIGKSGTGMVGAATN